MTPRTTGGSAYNKAIEEIDDGIDQIAELIEQLAPGIDNGNLHKFMATIMAILLKQQKALIELEKIGQEAKEERKGR
jgi:hypothetical protein